MARNMAFQLCEYGQSIWLDYISRSLIKTGKLKELISQGVRGLTSNPTIFDKSIKKGDDYDEQIIKLAADGNTTFEIYDHLTVRDIQDAADLFMPVFEESEALDGYVSLEVNPQLAFNTQETIKEAKRLQNKVSRPNVMFKVPATEESFPAIEELIACGININATLIFSLEQYKKTAEAYIEGLRRLHEKGENLSKVRSVASVFVSRIDTLCDKLLDEKIASGAYGENKEQINLLKGKSARANSGIIYATYQKIFSAPRFKELKNNAANVQRVLWGSTSTKNPSYSDIKYVEELIGKDTVNTMPQETFDGFLDHGTVKAALANDEKAALETINALNKFGIDINAVCAKLLQDGVASFDKSFDSLLTAIEQKTGQLCKK